jgi:putative aldouronate transport system substrate-binding protein
MKRRKCLALILATCSVLSLFSGCGKKDVGPATTKDDENQNVKLKLCLSQIGWGGGAIDPDLMNEVKSAFEKGTNTTIEMVAPPHNDYPNKLNVLLNSGDVPDVFQVTKAMDNVPNYVVKGYVASIDDYVKNSKVVSPEQKKYFDNFLIDGKYYGVPRDTPMSKVIWFRKDKLDAAGVKLSELPTTDEFYTEMKKLIGKVDVPFSLPKWIDNLQFFYNSFGGYAGVLPDKDGKYYDGFNTKETKEAITYLAKLYKDGILDKEFITTENAKMREMLIAGTSASNVDYYNRYVYYAPSSAKSNSQTEFQVAYGLKGPTGKSGNLNEAIQDAIVVSAKSKNVERAYKLAEYISFNKDGVKAAKLGVEGKHYTVSNGVRTISEKATNSGYTNTAEGFLTSHAPMDCLNFKWDVDTEKYLPRQIEIQKENLNHLGPKIVIPAGKSMIYNNNLAGYKQKMEETATKIILGTASLEDAFKDYEAYWKSINGEEMLKQLNTK